MIYKNKHSFITIFLCTALTALCGCTGDTDIDPISGNGNSPASGTPLEVRTTVAPFQNPDASTRAATRAVIDKISTKFENGDAIGLICFRQGPTGNYISEDISNLELVFTETADGTGTWATKSGEDAINYTDAVSYLAYYPYISALDLTGITDVDSAKKKILASFPSDYLANQQIPANFAMSDHMTAESTPVDVNGTPTLTLNFKHEFVLLVVKPMRIFSYIPPAGETAYKYIDMVTGKLDEKLVEKGSSGQKYRMTVQANRAYQMSDGSYAVLMPPELIPNNKVEITYTTKDGSGADLSISFQTSSHDAGYYKVGTCHYIEVHNYKAYDNNVVRSLQVGDFVTTANGTIEIIPGDWPLGPNGRIENAGYAMGMVTNCDLNRMTDKECSDKGWNHAYVMGLEDLPNRNVAWGPKDVQVSVLPEISITMAKDHMNGYSETATMLAYADLNSYPLFVELKKYRDSQTLPGAGTICSEWFIPSIGQWIDVLNHFGTTLDFNDTDSRYSWTENNALPMYKRANDQLKKVGRSLFPLDNPDSEATLFWTSSLRSTVTGWNIYAQHQVAYDNCWMKVSGLVRYSAATPTEAVTARPFFAF